MSDIVEEFKGASERVALESSLLCVDTMLHSLQADGTIDRGLFCDALSVVKSTLIYFKEQQPNKSGGSDATGR